MALRVAVEPLLPEAVGDHRGERAARLLLVGLQQPSRRDAHAQRLEEPGAHAVHRPLVGGVADRDAGLAALVAGHRLEAAALRLPVVEVLRRDVQARSGATLYWLTRHQPVRLGERQRPEQTELTTLKIAVVAPIPSASVMTAVSANDG